tara:strand:+ start:1471 stop:1710 length:240 start_codon:yes stop_codon:yes gene_type:complete
MVIMFACIGDGYNFNNIPLKSKWAKIEHKSCSKSCGHCVFNNFNIPLKNKNDTTNIPVFEEEINIFEQEGEINILDNLP